MNTNPGLHTEHTGNDVTYQTQLKHLASNIQGREKMYPWHYGSISKASQLEEICMDAITYSHHIQQSEEGHAWCRCVWEWPSLQKWCRLRLRYKRLYWGLMNSQRLVVRQEVECQQVRSREQFLIKSTLVWKRLMPLSWTVIETFSIGGVAEKVISGVTNVGIFTLESYDQGFKEIHTDLHQMLTCTYPAMQLQEATCRSRLADVRPRKRGTMGG